jgi:hypothetical protein
MRHDGNETIRLPWIFHSRIREWAGERKISLHIVFGLLVLLLFSQVSLHGEVVGLEVESRTVGRLGYTSYRFTGTDWFGDSGYSSFLEFPLNTVYLGASANLTIKPNYRREFELIMGALVNLTNPAAVMKDSDWVQPYGYPKLIFSYTRSPVELFAVEASIEGRTRLLTSSLKDLYATGGYRFLRYAENVIGYEGWYLDLDTVQPEDYTPNKDDIAIEYHITYHTPYMGLLWKVIDSSRFKVAFGSDLSLVFVSDYDDHRLRGKEMTASGVGFGVCSIGIISFYPYGQKNSRRPYIKLVVEANSLFANTKQTQEWYMDEVIDGETIPAGTIIGGIDHEIRSLQVGAALLVGMKLK